MGPNEEVTEKQPAPSPQTEQQIYWGNAWKDVKPVSLNGSGLVFIIGKKGVKSIDIGDDNKGSVAATIIGDNDKVMATVFGSFTVSYK